MNNNYKNYKKNKEEESKNKRNKERRKKQEERRKEIELELEELRKQEEKIRNKKEELKNQINNLNDTEEDTQIEFNNTSQLEENNDRVSTPEFNNDLSEETQYLSPEIIDKNINEKSEYDNFNLKRKSEQYENKKKEKQILSPIIIDEIVDENPEDNNIKLKRKSKQDNENYDNLQLLPQQTFIKNVNKIIFNVKNGDIETLIYYLLNDKNNRKILSKIKSITTPILYDSIEQIKNIDYDEELIKRYDNIFKFINYIKEKNNKGLYTIINFEFMKNDFKNDKEIINILNIIINYMKNNNYQDLKYGTCIDIILTLIFFDKKNIYIKYSLDDIANNVFSIYEQYFKISKKIFNEGIKVDNSNYTSIREECIKLFIDRLSKILSKEKVNYYISKAMFFIDFIIYIAIDDNLKTKDITNIIIYLINIPIEENIYSFFINIYLKLYEYENKEIATKLIQKFLYYQPLNLYMAYQYDIKMNEDFDEIYIGTNIINERIDELKVDDNFNLIYSSINNKKNTEANIGKYFIGYKYKSNELTIVHKIGKKDGLKEQINKLKLPPIDEKKFNLSRLKDDTFNDLKNALECLKDNEIIKALISNLDHVNDIQYMKTLQNILLFYEIYTKFFNSETIYYDFYIYKECKHLYDNFVNNVDYLVMKNIRVYNENLDECKSFYNVFNVQQEINELKWATFGLFSIYVTFYLRDNIDSEVDGYIAQSRFINGFRNNRQLVVEGRKCPMIKVPLYKLSDTFLMETKKSIREEMEEYTKSKEENSTLLLSYNPETISMIEISIKDIKLTNKQRIYGNGIPLKIDIRNNTMIEMSEFYQMYSNLDFKNNYQFNCFYNAIEKSKHNFTIEQLNKIKYTYGYGTITLNDLSHFCNDYNINMKVKRINYKLKVIKEVTNIYSKNNKANYEITICLLTYGTLNHFFPYNITPITKYCAANNKLEDEFYYNVGNEFNTVTNNKSDYLDSFDLMAYLIEGDYTKELSIYENELINFNSEKINYSSEALEKCIDVMTEQLKYNEKQSKSEKKQIYAGDTETYVNEEGELIPFCMCLSYEDKNNKIKTESFYGEKCQEDFVKYCFSNNIKEVYFHNLKFDGWLFKNFLIRDMVKHGGNLYSLKIINSLPSVKFLTLKDSLGLIPMKLKDFNKAFNLGELKKELYPYNLINKDNYKGKILASECKKVFNDKDYNEFMRICKTNGFREKCGDDYKIDIESLTLYYCQKDTEVLYAGLKKFQEMTIKEFNINATKFLTISSFAYNVMMKNCFKDLYSYRGDVREFIKKSIRGGRCMTAENKKHKVVDTIVDYDACSLYPSAMKRLLLPKGEPKYCKDPKIIEEYFNKIMEEDQIKSNNKKFISAMIVKVKILKVGKKLKFPLLSKRKNGISYYINEVENEEMILTYIELQDFIKYQHGEVEFIECLYWTGDRDDRMSKYIQIIYNKRVEYKRDNDPKQNVMKLLMNSAYGKTIQKEIKEEYVFKDNDNLKTYQINNYERIKEIIEINKSTYWIKLGGCDKNSFVPNIIGTLILGMSKRIMNEVMCLAELNDIPIYYQDTDSIHMLKSDLTILEDRFYLEYGRYLKGDDMGQFHVDFPLINNKETWSYKSIFLGKKCYIDCLINKDGEKSEFVRMKGIPQQVIKNTAIKYNKTLVELYEIMYEGEEIDFNLMNNQMTPLEFKKNFGIVLRKKFQRKLKF